MKDYIIRYRLVILLIQAYLRRFLKKTVTLVSSFKSLTSFILILAVLFFLLKIFLVQMKNPFVSEGMVGIYSETNLPIAVTKLLSEPLIKVDKSGEPKTNLVQGWQVNSDATVYSLRLKDNLLWNDGTPLRSSDIRFNLPNVKISYPNDKTVEFNLNEPFGPFPTLLSEPIFKGSSLIGVGSYQVVAVEKNQDIITKLKLVAKGNKLPVLTIRFYPDEVTLKTAFALGEISGMLDIADPLSYQNASTIKIKRVENYEKLIAIFYNNKDTRLMDRNLRLALSYAVPKPEEGVRAKSPVPPTSWVYNDKARDVSFNPEMVRSYLEKAHFKANDPIVLTVTPQYLQLGEKISISWKSFGLNVVTRIESGIPQNFQALLIAQPLPKDPDQYGLWHSTQVKSNLSHYSSPRVDKDLEEGRKIVDKETRKVAYLDFQKVLTDDAPAAFLFFPKLNIVYRKKIATRLETVLNLQYP